MPQTPQPTILSVDLTLPTSWARLTQSQLRDTLDLLAKGVPTKRAQARLALRWTHTHVIRPAMMGGDGEKTYIATHKADDGRTTLFTISLTQLVAFYEQLDFIGYPERCGLRLERLESGHTAINEALHGLSLKGYILADRAYSLYLDTRKAEQAMRLVAQLYPGAPYATPGEQLGAVVWFAYVKRQFAARWNYLYKSRSGGEEGGEEGDTPTPRRGAPFDPQAHQDQADAMIRALTGGDITKEPTVLQTDVWRALTELNAKAREAQQLKERSR